MQHLPIGIQSFKKLRENNLLYVDKTAQISRLVEKANYYFLSRPRRFGKSLLLSTLQELFSGNQAIFKGLWIENHWDWSQQHPVIHIGFSSIGYKTMGLEKAISRQLNKIAKQHNLTLTATEYDQQFKEILELLSAKKQRAVLLIDEYDKPIIDYLDDLPLAKANQKILKTFYSIIKDSDAHIRFLLITGVSKFSKVSIFSELNNLDDITIDTRFTDLVGITQSELESNFKAYLQLSQEKLQLDRSALLAQLKDWYNGYSWDGQTFVYNPFSILNFFNKNTFLNFWFATGTPTFLIKLLRERAIYDLGEVEVDQSVFESYDIETMDTYSLLFQTGYNTIKRIDEYGIYLLDYPNREIKQSLLRHLIGSYRNASPARTTPIVIQLQKAFLRKDFEQIISIINSLFKSIPSHIFIKEKEAYYHSIVFLIFEYLGQYIDAEVHTSDGRMDAVVQSETHVYIIEFKLDESADSAIEQIQQKDYGSRFSTTEKSVVGLGINFSSATKSVDDWHVVSLY